MKRDIAVLREQKYDVLVLGAGIHGAAVASACARAGLQTALIEKNDFGHATSANSLKILHGGLRYLQHLNIKRMRDSILSRRSMLQRAPHVARPLRCLIPNHGKGLHSNFFMRLGLLANDLVGFDRNRGVAAANRLKRGRVMARKELLLLFPDVVEEETSGASIWYDAIAVNSERLTLSFVREAAACGATVANYVEALELTTVGEERVVRVCDRLSDERLEIRASCVVNACGPWAEALVSGVSSSAAAPTSWAKAVNIVVKKELFPGYAVGLSGEEEFADKDSVLKKKGRFFFFVPWRGYTMIGTTYKPYSGSMDNVHPDGADVEEILSLINGIYPAGKLKKVDVSFVHAGLVPMTEGMEIGGAEVQLEKESLIVDHGLKNNGMTRCYSIKGVKYTTAPKVAAQLTAILCGVLQHSSTDTGDGPGGLENAHLPAPLAYLESRYGKETPAVLAYVERSDAILCRDPMLLAGEVDYMVAEEMACKLSDVVFRRSELATAELPSTEVLTAIAEQMGTLLDWDETRIAGELGAVKAVFSAWQ